MREIKFRAWNKKDSNPHARMIHPVTLTHDGKVIMPDGDEWDIPVMQFTGLLDKNGKEIYEGDIVKVELPERQSSKPVWLGDDVGEEDTTVMPKRTVTGIVRMNLGTGRSLLVKKVIEYEPEHKLDESYKKDYSIHIGSHLKIKPTDEVIGNIYENPELLS